MELLSYSAKSALCSLFFIPLVAVGSQQHTPGVGAGLVGVGGWWLVAAAASGCWQLLEAAGCWKAEGPLEELQ
jgi:hypothetical protein